MKHAVRQVGVLAALTASACWGSAEEVSVDERPADVRILEQDDGEDEQEDEFSFGFQQAIALDAVPAEIREAALAAAPGLVIKAAGRELTAFAVTYYVEGTRDGEWVEVEVSADGKRVVVEHDGQGGDDGEEEER